MAIDHGSRWRRWLERGLVVVGVLCLGWTGLVFAQTRLELHRARAAAAAFEDAPSVAAAVDSAAYEAQGPLTGLFEIPRLGLSAAIRKIAPARSQGRPSALVSVHCDVCWSPTPAWTGRHPLFSAEQ